MMGVNVAENGTTGQASQGRVWHPAYQPRPAIIYQVTPSEPAPPKRRWEKSSFAWKFTAGTVHGKLAE